MNVYLVLFYFAHFLVRIPTTSKPRGLFDHHWNPCQMLPPLYVQNIILAQKLTKLQHFKEHFWKENQNQTCLVNIGFRKWKYSIWYILSTCITSQDEHLDDSKTFKLRKFPCYCNLCKHEPKLIWWLKKHLWRKHVYIRISTGSGGFKFSHQLFYQH